MVYLAPPPQKTPADICFELLSFPIRYNRYILHCWQQPQLSCIDRSSVTHYGGFWQYLEAQKGRLTVVVP